MSMVIGNTASQVGNYQKYEQKKTADKKTEEKTVKEDGVVYEKSAEPQKKATYTINKMSASERKALVKQLKQDEEARMQKLTTLVQSMMSKQANTYGTADGIWKFLASGNYTVDAATKKQAQEDISENGYWGVKQTSQRLFDFASALAGDDVEKMKSMQAAIEKGYNQATKAWGKELPGICKDTLDATNKLFDEYYASKNIATK